MTTQPPVLLLHGFASNFEHNWVRTGWVDLLRDLGREVIGFELPGHGAAAARPPAGDLGAEVCGSLGDGVDVVDAVGFSAGADALLRAASTEPARFRRIVLLGIGESALQPRGASDLAHRIANPESDDVEANLYRRIAISAGNDPAALARVLTVPRPALTTETLVPVEASALVVVGELDFVGPPDAVAAALKDARVMVVPGMDHFRTVSDVRVIDAALDFLSGTDAS